MEALIRNLRVHLLLAAVIAFFAAAPSYAQEVVPASEPRPSPLALTQVTLDDGTYVKIHYGSPHMRGREIFGGLVPFGKVWRLGANEATEITTTQNIMFGGRELPAGTYSLVAIPEKDKWTLVVNKSVGQWGAFSYSADSDLFRIVVPAEKSDQVYEAFTMDLKKNEGEQNAQLVIVWDQTQLSVPIGPCS